MSGNLLRHTFKYFHPKQYLLRPSTPLGRRVQQHYSSSATMEIRYKLEFATELHYHRFGSAVGCIILLVLAVFIIWLCWRPFPSNVRSSSLSRTRTIHDDACSPVALRNRVQEMRDGAPPAGPDKGRPRTENNPLKASEQWRNIPETTNQDFSDNKDKGTRKVLTNRYRTRVSRSDSVFDPVSIDTKPAVIPHLQTNVTPTSPQTITHAEDAQECETKARRTFRGESTDTQIAITGSDMQSHTNKSELGNRSHAQQGASKRLSFGVICLCVLFIHHAAFLTFFFFFTLLVDTHFGKLEPIASFTRKTLQDVFVEIGDPLIHQSHWVVRDIVESGDYLVDEAEAHIKQAEQTLMSLQDQLTSIAISKSNKTKHDVVVSNFKILEDGIQEAYTGLTSYKGNMTELNVKHGPFYRMLDQATTNTPLAKAKSFTGDIGLQIRKGMESLSDPYAAATISLNQSLSAVDRLHHYLLYTIQQFPPSIPGLIRNSHSKAEASALQISREIANDLDGAKGWLRMGVGNASRFERAHLVAMHKWQSKEDENSVSRAAARYVSHAMNYLLSQNFQNWAARVVMQYGHRHALRFLFG